MSRSSLLDHTSALSDVPTTLSGSTDIFAIPSAGIVQGHTTGRYGLFVGMPATERGGTGGLAPG